MARALRENILFSEVQSGSFKDGYVYVIVVFKMTVISCALCGVLNTMHALLESSHKLLRHAAYLDTTV